jgi:hypothetical protein
MKLEMRRALAQESFEKKVEKVGRLLRLTSEMRASTRIVRQQKSRSKVAANR